MHFIWYPLIILYLKDESYNSVRDEIFLEQDYINSLFSDSINLS